MDKIMEFLPFLIPLVIAEFALLGYTLHHILTHKNYKRGNVDIEKMEKDFTKLLAFWKSIYLRKE